MTIEITAIEFDSAGEALQHMNASGYGDCVLSMQRKYYLTNKAEAQRVEAIGLNFAYVFDHEMPDGSWRIMTVPVND